MRIRILIVAAALVAPLMSSAVAPPPKKAAPKRPAVTSAQKAEATRSVQEHMADAIELGIQNAAAMVPFYELLHRREQKPGDGEPLRVLHFGDSHTASDDWANELRTRFQQKFGDGGPGFTLAGRPFLGYRRYDSKGSMSRGWKADGLLEHNGDGLSGIGGVSLTARRPGETLVFEAEGRVMEFFYLAQPGGGSFTLEDNGETLDTISSDGPLEPRYYHKELAAGEHRLVLRTTDNAPVRVYGWVLEKRGGITWETLGVNGAQADVLLQRDEAMLRSHIERRNPALVVLAYGTNEARRTEWTKETYRDAVLQVVARIRAASPTTSILIIGAPDQGTRRGRRPLPPQALDTILAAQREAALAGGCAFWNLRTAMGGRGSMKQWVTAGLAQADYVHLTSPGYRLVGDSLYELILGQYGIFQSVRQQLIGKNNNGPAIQDH